MYDSTRCFLVMNETDSQVDISPHAYFNEDAVGIRIKARVAAGIPVPAKSIPQADDHGASLVEHPIDQRLPSAAIDRHLGHRTWGGGARAG